MTHELNVQVPAWLAVAAVIFAILAIAAALKWRRYLRSIFALASVLITLCVIILIPLSWRKYCGTDIGWSNQTAPDRQAGNNLGLEATHGRMQFCFHIQEGKFYSDESRAMWNKLFWRAWISPNDAGRYLLWNNRFGGTQSDFVQKTLGFQWRWFGGMDPDGSGNYVGLYSITVPQWFVLVLSLILPVIWLRSHRRERRLRRRGFPVAASPATPLASSSTETQESGPAPSPEPTSRTD